MRNRIPMMALWYHNLVIMFDFRMPDTQHTSCYFNYLLCRNLGIHFT